MKDSCLITGASGDIGHAVTRTLAEQGYRLVLHYHQNRPAIEEMIAALPANTISQVISADLSKTDGIRQLIDLLNPDIESVVFAHGNSLIELFQETVETSMDEMLTSHVKAPWLVSGHLIPQMIKKKKGRIILVSSIWGEVGASCEVVYSSVKGAQNSFVKALGKELAPSGIAVNGVLPGFVETKMNAHLSKEEIETLISDIPANRAASTAEIAHVVAFLMNSNTTYMNGELIKVTGGW